MYGSVGYKATEIPAVVPARNIKGPVLFKFCRVEYNKKTNRLEIAKGEYIGKTLYRSAESTPEKESGEYYDFIVNYNLDEVDSQGENNGLDFNGTSSASHYHLNLLAPSEKKHHFQIELSLFVSCKMPSFSFKRSSVQVITYEFPV